MIGPLQTNKAKHAVGLFNLLHAVDSLRVAEAINEVAAKRNLVQEVLLEVNVSGELSKHGFSVEELMAQLGPMDELPNLRVKGLMTMAPKDEDSEKARPYFRQLRELQDRLASQVWLRHDFCELSMGMTQDFEVAIEEGATIVRVGSAIIKSTI